MQTKLLNKVELLTAEICKHMSIHYDKLTFTKEQVELDAETLNGIVEEDDMFYSIVFPFGNDKFEFKYEKNKKIYKE
tara:strand:- start:230 stop:460 length:231 start_codon:yes stop_codon:yes gene_type:complete